VMTKPAATNSVAARDALSLRMLIAPHEGGPRGMPTD
jgi:hypothetical protein